MRNAVKVVLGALSLAFRAKQFDAFRLLLVEGERKVNLGGIRGCRWAPRIHLPRHRQWLLTLPLGQVLFLGVDPDESGGQHRDAVLANLIAAMLLSPLFLRFPHRPSTRHKGGRTLLKQRHWGHGNRHL